MEIPKEPIYLNQARGDNAHAIVRKNVGVARAMILSATKAGHLVIEEVDGRKVTRKTCPDSCHCLPKMPSAHRKGNAHEYHKLVKPHAYPRGAPAQTSTEAVAAAPPANVSQPAPAASFASPAQAYKDESLRHIMKPAKPAEIPLKDVKQNVKKP